MLAKKGLEISSTIKPIVFVIVYVDDGLILAQNEHDIREIIEKLQTEFKVHKVEVNAYRGLEIVLESDRIFLHQAKYTKKIIEAFKMSQAKAVANPSLHLVEGDDSPLNINVPFRSAVGSLAYLADTTRPDISFSVNQLARNMAHPSEKDWKRQTVYTCPY
ncbi:MAG: hypothetical protein EOP04_09630 [Proteobacteria bacterium]|nr:MAG: hypothetical protein EOP04_09630 [Pseudomonadota bacterium]